MLRIRKSHITLPLTTTQASALTSVPPAHRSIPFPILRLELRDPMVVTQLTPAVTSPQLTFLPNLPKRVVLFANNTVQSLEPAELSTTS
jgi:hypothetical protein